MQIVRFILIITILELLFINQFRAQEVETVIKTDFVIRDFEVFKDSIFYIKKRHAFLFDKKTKTSKNYFIGGYGLKLSAKNKSNTVITVANELVDTVSSIRFYNKKLEAFEAEFFYKKGKILDFLLLEEAKLFVLSLTTNKVIFVDYKDSPEYYKTIEIKLNSLSRKLLYKDNMLYFATDNGNVYKYDFLNYKKTLVHQGNSVITEFTLDKEILIYTTIDGDIVKVNLNTNEKTTLKIDNNFISTFLKHDAKLICGSWSGKIYIIDLNTFQISKEFNFHKRAIVSIKKDEENTIYSSSLDKTIKSWKFN
jgi:outer membrane protein assembly factor BamB